MIASIRNGQMAMPSVSEFSSGGVGPSEPPPQRIRTADLWKRSLGRDLVVVLKRLPVVWRGGGGGNERT